LQERAFDAMTERGGRFCVMYGQSEACARITVLPHDQFTTHRGSAGFAIPGGALAIHDADGRSVVPGTEGDVVYRGPNVMMGYATTRDCLSRGDDLRGVLHTGDRGTLTIDGALRLTGRSKRIGKLHGVRVDLDAVETLASVDAETAVLEGQDSLVVFSTIAESNALAALRARIATTLRVQRRTIDMRTIDALPRTSAGKVDYPRLQAQL
jgi:acyl-coenzyme A synthetase/AMP-(fatty) acid ligase